MNFKQTIPRIFLYSYLCVEYLYVNNCLVRVVCGGDLGASNGSNLGQIYVYLDQFDI